MSGRAKTTAAPDVRHPADSFSEKHDRERQAAASAVLVLPITLEWVGSTPRIFGADGISPVVVANGQIGRQIVDALNKAHEEGAPIAN